MSFSKVTFALGLIISFGLVKSLDFEEINDSRSICPRYWTDATHMGMGCLLFNATTHMTWTGAQNFCGSKGWECVSRKS